MKRSCWYDSNMQQGVTVSYPSYIPAGQWWDLATHRMLVCSITLNTELGLSATLLHAQILYISTGIMGLCS